jgi:hypothetical protein
MLAEGATGNRGVLTGLLLPRLTHHQHRISQPGDVLAALPSPLRQVTRLR